MIEIEWDDSLTTGNEEIDEQHQGWLSLLNALHQEIMRHNNAETSVGVAHRALNDIRDYCTRHFECEENYMVACGYLEIERHKEIHRRFLAHLDDQETRIGDDAQSTLRGLFKAMSDWLIDHIMNEDTKIGFAQITPSSSDANKLACDSLIPEGCTCCDE